MNSAIVVTGRRSSPYISTDEETRLILVHQDNGPGKGSGGRYSQTFNESAAAYRSVIGAMR